MILHIALDNSLPDLSAVIRRDTLAAILKITSPGEKDVAAWRRVGSPFGEAHYALNPSSAAEITSDVLYVSPGVKKASYPNTGLLQIAP
jgi:hypothetical protein